MKKLIGILAVLAAMSLILVACNPRQTNNSNEHNNSSTQKKKFIVAMDPTYKPMEYLENGQMTGFDVDFSKALSKEMNREIELKNITWDEIFARLIAGEYDAVISSVTITDKRKKTMTFSDPYFDSTSLILTRIDSNIKSVADLAGKIVATQVDSVGDELVTTNVPGLKTKKFNSALDALNAFANKEVDAAIADAPVVLEFVKQKNDSTFTTVEDSNVFTKDHFGICINKSNSELVGEINAALKKVNDSGEYQKIYDKYFKNN